MSVVIFSLAACPNSIVTTLVSLRVSKTNFGSQKQDIRFALARYARYSFDNAGESEGELACSC